MNLSITRLGRGDFSETCQVKDEEEAVAIVYKKAGERLASRFYDVIFDPETKTGKVFAGFHCVGEFTVS